MKSAAGRVVTAESRLNLLTAELGLDAGQQAKFRPLLEDIAGQLARFPPASVERREIFLRYVPKMRELLRPDQFAAFDRYVQQSERRHDRVLRRRTR